MEQSSGGAGAPSAEEMVRAANSAVMMAYLRHDADLLDELFADDFVFTNPLGEVLSKPQELAQVRAGNVEYETFETRDVAVRWYGESAVVTGLAIVKGRYQGRDMGGHYRYTRVYANQNGYWKLVAAQGTRRAADTDVRGAWRPQQYLLKDGTRHPVDGLIFFTEKDWAVIFFVTENGQPMHGSAEAGAYTLNGSEIVFTHLYRLSVGGAVGALEEGPRMKIDDAICALTEPCRVTREGDALTIWFGPSGNAMVFRRSSGL